MFALPNTAAPRLHHAVAWWESLRGSRPMPAPPDIRYSEIPLLLANMLLVDMEAYKILRVGPGLRVRFGRDLTGHHLEELPGLERGTRVWHLWEAAAFEPSPHYLDVPYVASDRSVKSAQDLLLPFSTDGERIDQILASLEPAVTIPNARAA
jgi:hypothetical protein